MSGDRPVTTCQAQRKLVVGNKSLAHVGFVKSSRVKNPTCEILQQLVAKSPLSLRSFAEKRCGWDHSLLIRALKGKKAIGPAVIGRVIVGASEKDTARLIRAFLKEQKQIIENERIVFAEKRRLEEEQSPEKPADP